MPRFVFASALAAAFSLAAASGADAFTRTVSVHGPHGASHGRTVSCGGGACRVDRYGVGPRGYAYGSSKVVYR